MYPYTPLIAIQLLTKSGSEKGFLISSLTQKPIISPIF